LTKKSKKTRREEDIPDKRGEEKERREEKDFRSWEGEREEKERERNTEEERKERRREKCVWYDFRDFWSFNLGCFTNDLSTEN